MVKIIKYSKNHPLNVNSGVSRSRVATKAQQQAKAPRTLNTLWPPHPNLIANLIDDSGCPIGKPDYIISSPTLAISKVPAGNFAPCSKPAIALSFLKPSNFPTGYFLCSIFTNILSYATHSILHIFEKMGKELTPPIPAVEETETIQSAQAELSAAYSSAFKVCPSVVTSYWEGDIPNRLFSQTVVDNYFKLFATIVFCV